MSFAGYFGHFAGPLKKRHLLRICGFPNCNLRLAVRELQFEIRQAKSNTLFSFTFPPVCPFCSGRSKEKEFLTSIAFLTLHLVCYPELQECQLDGLGNSASFFTFTGPVHAGDFKSVSSMFR